MIKRESEAVAIVGLGGVFPKALDIPAFWKNILEGKDCLVEVPADRWDWRLYWDADPKAADKTYSKIGGFVEGFVFDPLSFRIPPPVAAQMDGTQQMAVTATRQALLDAGYEKGGYDPERTAVILGNSMGGARKDDSDQRVYAARALASAKAALERSGAPAAVRDQALALLEKDLKSGAPITEDSMPGELSNVIAGRVANLFDFRGPNVTVDAACASSLAALDAALKTLRLGEADLVVCGGVDRMMSPPAFVKFAKIGALSATGSRPFDAKADGFVMGEGAGVFLLKRLSDALRDGDRIYCAVRAVGSSSDGKGKGITAPNPRGQKLAVERAFQGLDYGPEQVGLIEAHGTSTPVGDAVEAGVLAELFAAAPKRSIGLGSVKSQIGHLKAAAGAAGLIKAAFALREGVLPPSIHFETPNPKVDWANAPFRVVTAPEAWQGKGPRRANVSAFGFGGTNFHAALEQVTDGPRLADPRLIKAEQPVPAATAEAVRGRAFVVRGGSPEDVRETLKDVTLNAGGLHGQGAYCAAFEAADEAKFAEKKRLLDAALTPAAFDAAPVQLKARGIYLSRDARRPKVAFLFPGQGSQYVDMLRDLRERYPVVRATFEEADQALLPALGRRLSEVVFSPAGATPEQVKAQEELLKATEYTQPAVLTAGVALLRLLKEHGVEPDVVCGHSLGEYGALVASGILDFKDALLAVSARGREMASVKVADNGKMASVSLPVAAIEPVLAGIPGYVAVANKNCPAQTVIAGATASVEEALRRFKAAGATAAPIPVSHAFHSAIVAPAQDAYRRVLDGIPVRAPRVPVLSNVTADYHPAEPAAIKDLLVRQIAAPVEFIRQVRRMHQDGVRVFVEVGPKRVLTAFVTSILEGEKGWVAVASNHPKRGGLVEFDDLLARLSAEGLPVKMGTHAVSRRPAAPAPVPSPVQADDQKMVSVPIFVSGVGIGAPGSWDRVFRDNAFEDILRGQNLIERLPEEERKRQADKNVVRLVKSDTGDHRFERLTSPSQVIQLAARSGDFDPVGEFGLPEGLAASLDRSSQLAIAAGLLALKDAGIPLVRTYRTTSAGTRIPVGWALPESLRSETGVIFASAFPGFDSLVGELTEHLAAKGFGKAGAGSSGTPGSAVGGQSPGQPAAYEFSRDFLLRVLTMGHSQMSQWIGAKGPSLHINAACASTTAAVGLAEDWIRLGRARRVVIIGADDITNPVLQEWFVTGFLAAGAATTETAVSRAALPFDRRRHGMIVGMGAVGLVVEHGESVRERGTRALAEVLSTEYANSAFHATRLDTRHVAEVMDRAVSRAERRHGLDRRAMAPKTLFMSHETYTPARGGSASAEVEALKKTFGPAASQVVVCNTKGFTGHTMGASIEDPVAIMAMVSGRVPPIANYREPDPELAGIRLSDGGSHDLDYAVRLGAGFGSQIAVSVLRRLSRKGDPLAKDPAAYQAWLRRMSGVQSPELEVVHNTLRIKDGGTTETTEATEKTDTPYSRTSPTRTAPSAVIDRPAVPVASVPSVSSVVSPAALDESSVTAAILEMVTAKTGYPKDMLGMDLDLEADLGVDTVKQAELMGMVRERWDLQQVQGLAVKDYPTLRHVVRFVLERTSGATETTEATERTDTAPSAAVAEAVPVASVSSVASVVSTSTVEASVLDLVMAKTGYPKDMLGLDLDLEADLGIDTVKQAEMFGMLRERFGLARQEGLSLKDYPTLRHLIAFVEKGAAPAAAAAPHAPSAPAPAAPAPAAEKMGAGPISGKKGPVPISRWTLKAAPLPLSGATQPVPSPLKIVTEDAALRAALAAQAAAAGVAVSDGEARTLVYALPAAQGPLPLFELAKREGARWERLVVLAPMDGAHGARTGAPEPEAGALTGLAKALSKELPACRVRAVDAAAGTPADAAARALWAELAEPQGPVETGWKDGQRYGLAAAKTAAPAPAWDLKGKSVLLTGGGQGLGAVLARLLAAAGARLTVLGRTPEHPEAAAWAALDDAGLKALKARLWDELKARDAKATPVQLEREFAKVTKARELHRNLSALRASTEARYAACDLADAAALEAAVRAAETAAGGAFDAVVHAAGLDESRLLADKTAEGFRRVYDAKASAAASLVRLAAPKHGQRWLFFSSVVARFGNAGQTDYAAANDFLCKLASGLRAKGVWATAVDLTAFSGTGMAARGSVEQVLRQAGVDFVEPEPGMRAVLAELLGASEPEVILAGRLGLMDPDGFLSDRPAPAAERAPAAKPAVSERKFSLESDPYLAHHAIAGTPYVPGVIGIETFLETAAKALGGRPDRLSDVRFALPIKLLRNRPATVRVKAAAEGGALRLAIESDFVTPQGIKLGDPRTHFTATADPAAALPAAPAAEAPAQGSVADAAAIYKLYFHGPGFQVLERITRLEADRVEAALAPLAPGAGPETVQGLPRLIEAMFQACGYRDMTRDGKTALPDTVRLLQVVDAAPQGALFVRGVFKGRDAQGRSEYDCFLTDAAGRLCVALYGYKMVPLS